jgi:hypothetical protein
MTKKNIYAGLTFLIACSLLMAACSPQATPAAAPTIDANMIYTQAAQTVQAGLAETPVVEPTTAPTDTPVPTATVDPDIALAMTATAQSVQPQPGNGNTNGTATATTAAGAQNSANPTATQALVLPTATSAVVAPPPKSTGDKGQLISQIPGDGSSLQKSASFDVELTFKNTGTTTWTKKYSLTFFTGDRMGSPNDVVMTKEVKPGDTITLKFTMKASTTAGTKHTIWVLRNADGVNFYSLWLDTEVLK